MSTRLSHFCNGILEAGWLVALVVVPLYFNPSSSRIFEPDKVALLRSVAVLVGMAWLVKAGAAWMAGTNTSPEAAAPDRPARRPAWHPMVGVAVLLLASYALATVFSILPQLSLWGYYGRLQGLYTTAAYLVFFFAVAALLRTREQVQRLVTTTLLVSLPVAAYGVLQHAGLDPLTWVEPVAERVQSTLGNPVFLAAFLAMVVPLTLYRLVEAARTRRFGLLGGYLALLALQGACILFTGSRGPVLGLTVGLLFGGLLWTLLRRRWRAAQLIVAGSLALVAVLTLINLPKTAPGIVQDVPYLNRLVRIADAEGSAEGRVLIWKGAIDLVTADPLRLALGYGPETLRFAYYPHYTAELGRLHGWQASVDRMHNETLDVLVTTGLVGLLIYLLLFTGLVYYGLRWMGLLASPAQRNAWLGLWLAGGAGAVLALRWAAQTWAFSGVALPLGLLAGLFLYLAGYAFTAPRRPDPADRPALPPGFVLLAVLLFSGILAHFVEINVGIAVGATRLLFWIYTALLVVLGVYFGSTTRTAGAAPKRGGAAEDEAPKRVLPVMSAMAGLLLVTMAYGFFARSLPAEKTWPTWGFLAATWLLAGLLLLAEARADGATPPSLRAAGAYAGLSLLPAGLFFLAQAVGLDAAFHRLLLYLLIVLGVLAAAALGLARSALPAAPRASRRVAALALVATLGAGAFLYQTNVRIVQANMHHLTARNAFQQKDYDRATAAYRRALALDPGQALYQLELAQLLASRPARPTETAAEREAPFREAERILVQAAARNPYEPYHRAALAEVYRRWAARTPEAPRRAEHYQQALDAYADAVRINPENVLVWRRWAETYEELGDRTRALETYNRVLAWDSTNAALYVRLGTLYRAEGQWPLAAAMYEGALRYSTAPLPAVHYALALVYRHLERPEDALRQSERAVALAPDEPGYRDALIDLYQRLGRCREALEQMRAALQRWPAHEALQARARLLPQRCADPPAP